jgi:hypothetical protein
LFSGVREKGYALIHSLQCYGDVDSDCRPPHPQRLEVENAMLLKDVYDWITEHTLKKKKSVTRRLRHKIIEEAQARNAPHKLTT